MAPVKVVSYKTDLKTLAQRMLDEKVSSFLVEKEGKVIGKIEQRDVLRALMEKVNRPSEPHLLESLQKWYYETPVGDLVTALSQAGI